MEHIRVDVRSSICPKPVWIFLLSVCKSITDAEPWENGQTGISVKTGCDLIHHSGPKTLTHKSKPKIGNMWREQVWDKIKSSIERKASICWENFSNFLMKLMAHKDQKTGGPCPSKKRSFLILSQYNINSANASGQWPHLGYFKFLMNYQRPR